jgi:hypothetical protein
MLHLSNISLLHSTWRYCTERPNSAGTPCTRPAQHARTYLVQLLLVDVVVIVRLRRHRGMRTPHGIEGAHQAGAVPPLSKDWSKSVWINDIVKTHSAA